MSIRLAANITDRIIVENFLSLLSCQGFVKKIEVRTGESIKSIRLTAHLLQESYRYDTSIVTTMKRLIQ